MIAISRDGQVRVLENNDYTGSGGSVDRIERRTFIDVDTLAACPSLFAPTTAFLVSDYSVIRLCESDAIANINNLLATRSPSAGIPSVSSNSSGADKKNTFDTEGACCTRSHPCADVCH